MSGERRVVYLFLWCIGGLGAESKAWVSRLVWILWLWATLIYSVSVVGELMRLQLGRIGDKIKSHLFKLEPLLVSAKV